MAALGADHFRIRNAEFGLRNSKKNPAAVIREPGFSIPHSEFRNPHYSTVQMSSALNRSAIVPGPFLAGFAGPIRLYYVMIGVQ